MAEDKSWHLKCNLNEQNEKLKEEGNNLNAQKM